MEKRVQLPLSAADHEAFNGAAHDARVSLAAWVRMACREKLCGKRTVADSIARFEAMNQIPPAIQKLAERIGPAMVEDAAEILGVPKPAVITAPARKVPLPPSKRRGKSSALKEAADGVVPGPSGPVITTYPLTGIPRVRPSAPAAAGIPEIPDFEELMVDVSTPTPITEEMPKLFPLVETGLNETARPKFKRHPKCETEKCERLGPSCELCRLANTVSF